MNRTLILLCGACVLALLLAGCRHHAKKTSGIDWSVSLSHEKTTPYGSSIAYESLPDYFPHARREPLSKRFHYTAIDRHMYGGRDSASLLVLLGLGCHLTDDEWTSLLRFASEGNEVFLLSSNLDARLQKALHIGKARSHNEEQALGPYHDGREGLHALRLATDSSRSYGYVGRSIGSYFYSARENDNGEKEQAFDADDQPDAALNQARMEAMIHERPNVLGTAHGKPDFLRYGVGKGHITLHAAPLVLSNYFLLQPGNRAYLDGIWHSFPANISAVYWNEYFQRTTEKSSLSVLFKYPATRWALIIALCTLLLYVLFGLKRRQRVVPVIPPAENTSVVFAETVGRLYFNKGNHANLAVKMVQHFLEWVRSNYYLDTAKLDEDFMRRLAAKSGRPEAEVAILLARIHELRLGAPVSSEYLYQLHQEFEKFYRAP